jgi:hypothetical protein
MFSGQISDEDLSKLLGQLFIKGILFEEDNSIKYNFAKPSTDNKKINPTGNRFWKNKNA